MTPYRHQQQLLDLNPSKHLMAWGTGSGKTLGSLLLAKQKGLPVLIITKKDLVKKWTRDCAATLGQLPYLVLSKEKHKAQWYTLPAYWTVICDEAHHFSSLTSGLHKALSGYLRRHSVQNVYLLTATPYRSTPWNVFALAQLLGHSWSYSAFRDRFFDTQTLHYRRCPAVPRCPGCRLCCRTVLVKKEDPDSKEAIARALRTLGSVVRLEDCVDLPEQVFRVEQLPISTEQKRLYKQFVEGSPATRASYRHRIESGHVYGEGYAADQFLDHCPLVERVMELAQEFSKLVVVCKFRLQMEHLSRLLEADGTTVMALHGDVKDRDAVVAAANAAQEAVLLVQAQCSEGYELPQFSTVIFASQDYALVHWTQMIGRVLRINAVKRNLYIVLYAEKGVGQEVYESVASQRDYDPARYENH